MKDHQAFNFDYTFEKKYRDIVEYESLKRLDDHKV